MSPLSLSIHLAGKMRALWLDQTPLLPHRVPTEPGLVLAREARPAVLNKTARAIHTPTALRDSPDMERSSFPPWGSREKVVELVVRHESRHSFFATSAFFWVAPSDRWAATSSAPVDGRVVGAGDMTSADIGDASSAKCFFANIDRSVATASDAWDSAPFQNLVAAAAMVLRIVCFLSWTIFYGRRAKRSDDTPNHHPQAPPQESQQRCRRELDAEIERREGHFFSSRASFFS